MFRVKNANKRMRSSQLCAFIEKNKKDFTNFVATF